MEKEVSVSQERNTTPGTSKLQKTLIWRSTDFPSLESLNGIFSFLQMKPNDDQSATVVEDYMNLFSTFIEFLGENNNSNETELDSFSEKEMKTLGYVMECFRNKEILHEKLYCFKFYPEYGANLIYKKHEDDLFYFNIIALDEWKLTPKVLDGSNVYHDAISHGFCEYDVGSVESDDIPEFLTQIQSLMDDSKSKTGNQRSAKHGSGKGHQKTPAFFYSVVLDSLSVLEAEDENAKKNHKEHSALGGTTDVGLHTGGQKRSTCYPLVKYTIEKIVGKFLGRKFMFHFHLTILDAYISNLESTVPLTSPIDLDNCIKILDVCADEFLEFNNKKFSYHEIDEVMIKFRCRLDHLAERILQTNQQKFVISDILKEKKLDLELPKVEFHQIDDEDIKDIEKRALRNLISCASCNFNEDSKFKDVLSWMDSIEGSKLRASEINMLILKQVDNFFLHKSNCLKKNLEFISELGDMKKLLEKYSKNLSGWLKLNESNSLMNCILRSHELLNYWIGCALGYHWISKKENLLLEFGFPINWEDLKYIVLDSSFARKVSLEISEYIESNQRTDVIFSLAEQTGTLDFASNYAEKHFMRIYNKERELIEWKEREYFEQVLKQLKELEGLRKKWKLRKDESKKYYSDYLDENCSQFYRLRYQKKVKEVQNIESEIKQIKVPPHYLVHAIPQTKKEALEVLFFMNIPIELDIFSWLCYSAQESLVPKTTCNRDSEFKKNNINDEYATSIGATNWKQHYNQHKDKGNQSNSSFYQICNILKTPKKFGPDDIEDIQRGSQASWYPINHPQKNIIQCSTGKNPFRTQLKYTKIYFSDKVPTKDIQWMVEFPFEEKETSDRGNFVYSKEKQKLDEYSQKAFIEASEIRAYPNNQLLKVIRAIVERNLPFGTPEMQTLIFQALYQLGDIKCNNNNDIFPIWHTDFHEENGNHALLEALKLFHENISQKVREHESMYFLAELSSYVSQFVKEGIELSRSIRKTCKEWAQIIKDQFSQESNPHTRLYLLTKECLMYGYGILTFKYGEMTEDDAEVLMSFYFAFKNGLNDREHSGDLKRNLDVMETSVSKIISSRINEISRLLTNEIITRCVKVILSRAPNDLIWKEIPLNEKPSYSRISSTFTDIYTVDLLTGIVCENGAPPARLPKHILEHELYKMVFGNRDFHVSMSQGILKSAAPIEKYFFYEFRFHNSKLEIKEIDTSDEKNIKTLVLLDFQTTHKWFEDLPIRLSKMNSHWLNEELNIVVFRGLEYSQRNVQYLLDLTEQICFVVEPNSKFSNYSFTELFKSKEYLNEFYQIESKETTTVLKKFEMEEYIHIHRTVNNEIQFHLPRFHLTFTCDNNGNLQCEEHHGFQLCKIQMLGDCLPFFSQYLILENVHGKIKLLIPDGKVQSVEGKTSINFSSKYDNSINHFVYDEIECSKLFKTNSVVGRLQWAAILASSFQLVDKRLKMTGLEAAIEILNECLVSRPLKEDEFSKLTNVFEFSHREPALAELCHLIRSNSKRSSFLHLSATVSELDDDHRRESMNIPRNHQNFRKYLKEKPLVVISEKNKIIVNLEHYCPKLDVKNIEMELNNFLKFNNSKSTEPFPLLESKKKEKSTLALQMMEELEKSWDTFTHTHDPYLPEESYKDLFGFVSKILIELNQEIEKFQTFLGDCCFKHPDIRRITVMIASNKIAVPCFNDYLKCAVNDEHILKLNPHLSKESTSIFKKNCLKFLELYALKQKLTRLNQFKGDESSIIRELSTVRCWDINEFPSWLVFEVEGEIQIRNEQFKIAEHLMQHPGAISQLNMGLGKTRVILPMLILHFLAQKKSIRVHIMKPLLQETIDYFHYHLTASTLNVMLLEQPFHRDIELTSKQVTVLKNIIGKKGCCQILAPEHRLSLHLKSLEIKQSNPNVHQLITQLNKLDYVDIIDESDELLSHKYQLTYSVGTPDRLNEVESRSEVAEALLRVINESPIHKYFDNKFGTKLNVKSKCEFQKFQLISTNMDQYLRDEFKLDLVKHLFENPPPELYWVPGMKDKHEKNLIEDILNVDKPISDKFESMDWFPHLLALRGYIGHGIFEHCLEQIHRVNYGISEKRTKKLAVPFKHADVPTERSEFSHPDVSIILTILSYYNIGLTFEQFKDCLRSLLKLGIPAQQSFYKKWYHPISDEISDEEKLKIDDVTKVDMTNHSQMELLYSKYKYSMEVVNFWLNEHVFPVDTAQYPKRISASPWDLADGKYTVGFSGTNDNHRLFPHYVSQNEPDIPIIIGTNGRMLYNILNHTLGVELLDVSQLKDLNKSIRILLLDLVIESKRDALIDAGSLLAGISNRDAAFYLIGNQNFDKKFRGVCFFDTSETEGKWVILDRKTQKVIDRIMSHIPEKDTFVIFDDARTRGADMKLNQNAVALITLGEGLNKDKLMQGAGRMRKLEFGQKLVMVCLPSLADKISSYSKSKTPKVLDVLEWIMDNTKSSTQKGLNQWQKQGDYHLKSKQNSDNAEVDENWDLKNLYEGPITEMDLCQYISEMTNVDDAKIIETIEMYGKDHVIHISSLHEESEKEIQLITEQQEQQEIQISKRVARTEKSWNYAIIFNNQLPDDARTLQQWINDFMKPEMQHLNLNDKNIFCTPNFFQTIVSSSGLDCYLRYADSMLYFPATSKILLISDFEANSIRELMWEHKPKNVMMTNLFLIKEKKFDSLSLGASAKINESCITKIQLYNGETTYNDEKQAIIESIIKEKASQKSIRHLIESRMLISTLQHSDLDNLMKKLNPE